MVKPFQPRSTWCACEQPVTHTGCLKSQGTCPIVFKTLQPNYILDFSCRCVNLKTQAFRVTKLFLKGDSGKDPDAGRDWGRRRKGQQRMRWLDGITDSMDIVWVNSGSWWWAGRPGMLRFIGLPRVGHDWATELNWTKITLRVVGV